MNRLSVKLIVAFVGMTLMTLGLLIIPQLRGIAADRVVLPVEERPVLTAGAVGRALLVRGYTLHNGQFAAVLGYDAAAGFTRDDRTMLLSPTSTAVAAIPEPTVPRRDIVAFLRNSLERRSLALIGSASL
ncbi:MAG TPA: hypothetical protein VFN03_09120, partial [Trueperaceae bacterium]|nr:hypothetical protein [Trueperaceae bacterium]